MNGALRWCPNCGGPWPKDADHALRRFAWLDDLPRGISVSNLDGCIHDGHNGRNRFLGLETKRIEEPWPPLAGQARFLTGLARLPGFTVRVLRGSLDRMAVHKVTEAAVEERGRLVEPRLFRGFVADWLTTGRPWEDVARIRGEVDLVAEAQRIFGDDLVLFP